MADRRYNPALGLFGIGSAMDAGGEVLDSVGRTMYPFAYKRDPAVDGQKAALRGDVAPPAPPPPPDNDPGFAPPHPTRREMVTKDPAIEGQRLGITGRSMTSRFPQQPDRNLNALRRNQEQSFIRPLMQTSGEPMSAADMENRKGAMNALDDFYGTEDELRGDHQADTFQNEQFQTALAQENQKQRASDVLSLNPFAKEQALSQGRINERVAGAYAGEQAKYADLDTGVDADTREQLDMIEQLVTDPVKKNAARQNVLIEANQKKMRYRELGLARQYQGLEHLNQLDDIVPPGTTPR